MIIFYFRVNGIFRNADVQCNIIYMRFLLIQITVCEIRICFQLTDFIAFFPVVIFQSLGLAFFYV